MKFMMEIVTLLLRIIYVFCDEDYFPASALRNVRSPFPAARVILCRAQIVGAVVKVLLVLEAMRR